MARDFFDQEMVNTVDKLFYFYEQEFIKCNYDFEKMSSIYKKYLSDMSPELVNSVNESCIGYYLYKNLYDLVEKCTSINELLHVLHSYIVNDENYYQSMPKVEEKINIIDEKIVLYGSSSELAKKIFDAIPIELDLGATDILALNKGKKVLMMVRDKGHALSIEIDDEGEKIWVKYFIPKICDIEEAKKIRGIEKVEKLYGQARGTFLSSREEIIEEIVKLINGVPVDKKIENTMSVA